MKRARNNERGMDWGAYFIFEALLPDTVFGIFAHIITYLDMQNYKLGNHKGWLSRTVSQLGPVPHL